MIDEVLDRIFVNSSPLAAAFKALSSIGKRFGLSAPDGEPVGSQRPVSNWSMAAWGEDSAARRNYDLEIPLNGGLIRDAARLRNLLEMRTYCPEIKKAVAIQRDDLFSSENGDDQGLKISKWLDDEESVAIDPEVKTLLDNFLYSQIGAQSGKPIMAEALSLGDSFAEIIFDKQITKILGILRLPVGEMFRVEDDKGRLLRFEQRRHLVESTACITYHPLQIIHWRYQPVHLYGESLYEESLADWEDLKEAERDLAKACRDLGVIPVQHEMPSGSTRKFLDDYRSDHIAAKRMHLVTDMYTMPGVKIGKISTSYPNLAPLVDRVVMRRRRIAMACRRLFIGA
jgi:hypothetical protein